MLLIEMYVILLDVLETIKYYMLLNYLFTILFKCLQVIAAVVKFLILLKMYFYAMLVENYSLNQV